MSSLYLLTAEYKEVADRLSDSDLPEEVIADTLESLTGAIEDKGKNIGLVIRNIEASATAIREAAAKMIDRAKAEEKRADGIKKYLLENMIAAGIKKIESTYFVITVRDNPESVVIDADSQVPADYMREIPVSYAVDKNLVKKAIQDGFEVPGCHLTSTKSLQIK